MVEEGFLKNPTSINGIRENHQRQADEIERLRAENENLRRENRKLRNQVDGS